MINGDVRHGTLGTFVAVGPPQGMLSSLAFLRRAGPSPSWPGPQISIEMRDSFRREGPIVASCEVGQEGEGTLFPQRDALFLRAPISRHGIPRPA